MSEALAKLVTPHNGTLLGVQGKELAVDFSLLTTSSVRFDPLNVPSVVECGTALLKEAAAVYLSTKLIGEVSG